MNLRPRTVRRLMILLGAVLVLVGIGAALYFRNEQRKADKLATARAAGMAAYKAGDYRAALEPLGFFVGRNKTDAQALYAYGVSRTRIEEPNNQQIAEGIKIFRAVLELDPHNLEATHTLLDLYTQAYYNNEAIELADSVLKTTRDDIDALRAKCTALDRTHKDEQALVVSEKINQLLPDDLDQQIATYRLMHSLNRPPATMLARAQKQLEQHPGNPRFEMLLAWVYGSTGDFDRGKQLIRQAATRPAPDATYVRYMVRVLDSLKLYKDTQELLDRAVAQNPDPQVMRILVQRLWQNGKLTQVIERLKSLDPQSPQSDAELLAYRALALFESGDPGEARALIAFLGRRKTDAEAIAWYTALSARFAGIEPKAALAQYQAALVRAPENAVIRYLVGEAYARLGETELAIVAWRKAAEMSPSWAGPHVHAARTLAAADRLKEAVEEARRAYVASPDELSIVITFANIQYRALEQGVTDAAAEPALLTFISQIQESEPGEPETLPAYVSLLARVGRREDAIAAARGVLSDPKKYDQPTILRLITVSRAHQLGLEAELQKQTGDQDTPRVALARAADLAASGKPLDGLSLLQSHVKTATTQPVQWQLALTQYKDLIRDPSATADWISLGDANPDELPIQTAVLKSPSARVDRDFIARTIERVKTLTGAEGQTWKIERARWLIGSDSSKDAAEAVNTLTEIVRQSPTLTDARLLLASAYEAVGNAPAAVKELQAAAELEPANPTIAIELARELQQQGRFPDARTYLERAATAADLSSDRRRTIAAMLAAQGDLARGVKILRDSGDKLDVPGQLLLAELLRRQRHFTDAEAIYGKLLAATPVSIDTIRAAADFYATQQKLDVAQKVLAELPAASSRPGAAELVMAEFNERHVNLEAARKSYISATAVAPTDPSVWRRTVAFYLRAGRFDDARQSAEDGLKLLPNDVALKRLRIVAETSSQMLSSNAALRPLIVILAAAAPDDRGASEFLTPTSDPTSQPTTDLVLARLKDAAVRNPRSLPLRNALVQWYLARHDLDAAGKAAAATMDAFPTDPLSARTAAMAYRDAGQWELAAAAAQRWRDRTPEGPAAADRMIADIRLSQGDAAGALKVIEPYAAALAANPQSDPGMFETYLHAQVIAGHDSDAQAALQPLLAKGRMWRSLWIQLAGSNVKAAEAATDWLNKAAATVAADDLPGNLELASAWYTLATRTHDEAALAKATTLLDPIVAKSDAPGGALLLRGAIAERAGDAKSAEDLYRRGLVLSPDEPNAMNNLAYLLLQRGGDLTEAHSLADRAISLSPTTASFYDTLARIQLKQGERDAAVASFGKAIKLEPANLEALVGLATTFCDAGKRESAAPLLPQIDALIRQKPAMSPQLLREIESLRATMKASL